MTTAHVAIITLTYTTKHTYFSHTHTIFSRWRPWKYHNVVYILNSHMGITE